MIESRFTRFRAYHLGDSGSSFSYFAHGHFTVIEGRLTDASRPSLILEMNNCGVTFANTLHITSWNSDHCRQTELGPLLELIKPTKIERPGYEPLTVTGIASLELIKIYEEEQRRTTRPVEIISVSPSYIAGLQPASALAYQHTLYNPLHIDPCCCNNNSTAKHFRGGSFNVLSLGDIESPLIGSRLRRDKILGRETDVMILAHHGADNGFTTKKMMRHLEPSVAICSSNYSNQYDHPREEIRQLLFDEGITLYTTKTGDVIIKSVDDHTGVFKAVNLIGKNKEVNSEKIFVAKKRRLLNSNADTLRQTYAKPRRVL